MTDIIKEAQELVEKFDGKITEGYWEVGSHFDHILTNKAVISRFMFATEDDLDAMSSVPEMLSLIKGLLSVINEMAVSKIKNKKGE